jgi:hypothetical protein
VLEFELVLVEELLESVLDLRRRKGRDGTRYDGKIDGDMSKYSRDRDSKYRVFWCGQNVMLKMASVYSDRG